MRSVGWLALVAGLVVAPTPALAQLGMPVPPGTDVVPPGTVRPGTPTRWTVEGQEVEGVVTSIDRAGGTITLDNGEQYRMPVPAGQPPVALEPGASVRIRYGVEGGQNIVTALRTVP
jgi:hypothetical protein